VQPSIYNFSNDHTLSAALSLLPITTTQHTMSDEIVNIILIEDYNKVSKKEETYKMVLEASKQPDLNKFTRAIVT
jgi:hypothetical protein